MAGRILVVDDLPDLRATIAGVLEDAGHWVVKAASLEEALHLLGTERFHVAILDVRLDESDEDNQEGIELMHKIGDIDPTIAIIILTAHANVSMVQEALQPDNESSRRLAFGFLQKSEINKLPEYVRLAIKNYVGIADDLLIDDLNAALPQIAERLRFTTHAQPGNHELLDELREVLAKLFSDCERIQIFMVNQGFSGAGVLEITPWYRVKGQGENRIAKLGELSLIEQESHNYSHYIEGMLGGHRSPQAINVSRTRSLAGILYTYAGMGNVQDFKVFCQDAPIEIILSTLENLYLNTCASLLKKTGRLIQNENLKLTYMNHLHLTEKKLGLISMQLTGDPHPFRRNIGKIEMIFANKTTINFVDPMAFVLNNDLIEDYYIGIIHGDLYGNNILIDHNNETWLIDFERTGEGPILQDYASLDNYARLYLYQSKDLEMWLQWESSFLSNSLIASFENEYMEKIYHIVRKIRMLAAQTPFFSRKNYLIGLLFNALRTTTFLELSFDIRNHALLSACLIAEQISKEMQNV